MNIIKYGKLFLIISLLIIIPGLISLFLYGLNLSIEFTGGSVIEYAVKDPSADKEVLFSRIKDIYAQKGVEIKELKWISATNFVLKAKEIDVAKQSEVQSIFSSDLDQVTLETVGPVVGAETTKNAFVALIVASLGILFYIAYAFRNIPKPFSSLKFGISAIIAMLHDVLVVVGIFSILGKILGIEIDSLFITALLTIVGFSVHDTIVVFDRIRENLIKLPKNKPFSEVVNYSLVETLNRSLATSLTVIITLSSLLLLGGASIKYFSLALLIGIVSGTYSSIFTASPILVLWEKNR